MLKNNTILTSVDTLSGVALEYAFAVALDKDVEICDCDGYCYLELGEEHNYEQWNPQVNLDELFDFERIYGKEMTLYIRKDSSDGWCCTIAGCHGNTNRATGLGETMSEAVMRSVVKFIFGETVWVELDLLKCVR